MDLANMWDPRLDIKPKSVPIGSVGLPLGDLLKSQTSPGVEPSKIFHSGQSCPRGVFSEEIFPRQNPKWRSVVSTYFFNVHQTPKFGEE